MLSFSLVRNEIRASDMGKMAQWVKAQVLVTRPDDLS